jgi:hypothetical protein
VYQALIDLVVVMSSWLAIQLPAKMSIVSENAGISFEARGIKSRHTPHIHQDSITLEFAGSTGYRIHFLWDKTLLPCVSPQSYLKPKYWC